MTRWRRDEETFVVSRDHLVIRGLILAGRHEDAERRARDIISRQPDDADAYHLLGLVMSATAGPAAAVPHLQAAVALDAARPEFHANLAEALRRSGRPDDGLTSAERATALDPEYPVARVNAGVCCKDLRDFPAALDHFDVAIRLDPGDAATVARRADVLREMGRIHEAKASYERALMVDEALAHAHANLAPLLLAMGEPDGALEHARRAVELEPDRGGGYVSLGTCLTSLERFDEAMDAFADAMEHIEPDAELCRNIGAVWMRVRDFPQAEYWLERAVALAPDSIETRCALASLDVELGRLDPDRLGRAVTQMTDLVESDPTAFQAHLVLASALWELGDAERAVSHLERAQMLRPEFANIHATAGNVLSSAGEAKRAIDSFYRALSQNPRSVPALVGLASSLRGDLESQQRQEILKQLDNPRLSDGAKAALHHGLAFYHDGVKEWHKATTHLADANRLRLASAARRNETYDSEDHRSRVSQTIATFTPTFFERRANASVDDARPVFIVGMPRSGTTLTEQVLATHPAVFGVGERTFGANSLYRATRQPAIRDAIDAVARVDAATIEDAGRWHLRGLEELVARAGPDTEPRYIVDKLPDNYGMLGWIALTLPKARVIHLRRDVRDVALSCWFQNFGRIRWADDLDHLADRIVQYLRLMDHWREVLPLPMYELDYEAFVSDLEGEARKLIDWLGLDWDPKVLEYYKAGRLVRTASVTQVRKPVYTKSIGRWRNYTDVLEPLIARLDDAGLL